MKLMALARADDPEAAAAAYRERDRQHKASKRREVADVCDQSNVVEFPAGQSKVEYMLALIESLSDQQHEAR